MGSDTRVRKREGEYIGFPQTRSGEVRNARGLKEGQLSSDIPPGKECPKAGGAVVCGSFCDAKWDAFADLGQGGLIRLEQVLACSV